MYGTAKNEAIINAADPIMGGVMVPPVEAVASTAAEYFLLYPARFILGIVIAPVVTVFEIALPLSMPKNALPITETFAAPPRVFPKSELAMLKKKSPPPV